MKKRETECGRKGEEERSRKKEVKRLNHLPQRVSVDVCIRHRKNIFRFLVQRETPLVTDLGYSLSIFFLRPIIIFLSISFVFIVYREFGERRTNAKIEKTFRAKY